MVTFWSIELACPSYFALFDFLQDLTLSTSSRHALFLRRRKNVNIPSLSAESHPERVGQSISPPQGHDLCDTVFGCAIWLALRHACVERPRRDTQPRSVDYTPPKLSPLHRCSQIPDSQLVYCLICCVPHTCSLIPLFLTTAANATRGSVASREYPAAFASTGILSGLY